MQRKKPLKVVFITGKGHNGSTLINLVLGSSKTAFSLGEAKLLSKAVEENVKCDCGKSLDNCEFWSQIEKPEKFCDIDISTTKKFSILLEFIGLKKKKQHFESKEFYEKVLKEARKHKGKHVDTLIDNSKNFVRGMYLSNLGLDIKFVHILKDVRNFAYSDYKRDRFSWKLIWSWYMLNVGVVTILKFKQKKYFRISYELFTQNWQKYIQYINRFTNLKISKESLIENINTEQYHNFAGNPMRKKDFKKIYHDDKWKENLPAYLKILLTIFLFIPNYILVYRDSSKLNQ